MFFFYLLSYFEQRAKPLRVNSKDLSIFGLKIYSNLIHFDNCEELFIC